MAYPPSVSLAVVEAGSASTFFGDSASITAKVTPVLGGTKYIVHAATGHLMVPAPQTFTAAADSVLSFSVPHVDQAGWQDSGGNAYTMWAYKVDVTVIIGNGRTSAKQSWVKNVQPLIGQDFIDLDLVGDGTIGSALTAEIPELLSVNGQTGHVTIDGGGGTLSATETEPGVYVIEVA